MARSMASKIPKKQRRPSFYDLRNRPQFKRRRVSRKLSGIAFSQLNLEVREPEPSDGIWPIVAYLVKTKNSVTTPSIRRNSRRRPTALRKRLSKRFNVFEQIVQEQKEKSVFDLSVLTEEPGEPTKSNTPENLIRSCDGASSSFTLVSGAASLYRKSRKPLLHPRNKKLTTLREEDQAATTSVSASVRHENTVEVITLTDETDEENSVLELECTENEITVIDEVVGTPVSVAHRITDCTESSVSSSLGIESTVRTAATVEVSGVKMSSYSYKQLRKVFACASLKTLCGSDISYLPFADGLQFINDLLTEGTAKVSRRLLRKWEAVQSSASEGLPFRLCSYNVLCQDTMEKTEFLYGHLKDRRLSWDVRSSLLAREFIMMNADVLCLQEVQNLHFTSFYQPFLESLGYNGVFKKRTRDMVDGCAIFYRNKFDLVSHIPIEYFVSTRSILDRDNIGQIVRLKDSTSGREFCVANTHLLYNTKRGDIKLAQLAILLAHLDKICGPSAARSCPYILCGDFNMSPYCPIYDFLLQNSLSFKSLRRNDLSGQGFSGGPYMRSDFMPRETNINTRCQFYDRSEGEPYQGYDWSHNLNFASLHNHLDVYDKREISSFNCIEALNPDFVFYSVSRKAVKIDVEADQETVDVYEKNLKLLRRLSLPNEEALRATLGPWPNFSVPSDHIPLIADFLLT